jgi:hypothetical protein
MFVQPKAAPKPGAAAARPPPAVGHMRDALPQLRKVCARRGRGHCLQGRCQGSGLLLRAPTPRLVASAKGARRRSGSGSSGHQAVLRNLVTVSLACRRSCLCEWQRRLRWHRSPRVSAGCAHMLALAPHHTKQGGCQDVGAVVPKRQPSRLCAAAHGLALVTYLRTPVAHCMTLSAAKAPLQQRPASPGHVCTDGRSCISRRVLHSCVAAGALAAGHTPSCCERPDAVFSGCALAPRRRTCSRCWTMRPGGSWRPSAAGLPRAHPNGPTPRPPRPRLPTLPARRPAARPARPAGTARAAPPRSCPAGPLAARPARLAAAAGSRWRQPPPRRQRGRRLERLSLAARLRAADPRSLRCRVRPGHAASICHTHHQPFTPSHRFLSGPPTRSSRFLNPPPPSG